MNKKLFRLLGSSFLLASMVLLFSCSSQKELSARKGPIGQKTTQHLMTKLEENEFQYEWLSMKASTEVTFENKKTSFRANIRMRRDSMIWISISPLMGIEIARAAITPDTVYFLNRLSNNYFIGDFQYINDMLNVDIDFDDVQALLLGNSIGMMDENDRLKTSVDEDFYLISNFRKRKLRKHIEKSKIDDILHSVWLDPENYKVARMAVHDLRLDKALLANYSNFQQIEDQLFPGKSVFMVQADNPMSIATTFSKIDINKELSFPFKIPEKYVQIY